MDEKEAIERLTDHFRIHYDGRPTPYLDKAVTFEDGVIVIKHWRMHNTLSRDRYTETSYIDEKRMLLLKENGSYSLASGNVIDDTKLIERSNRQTHNRRNKDATKTHSDKDIGLDKDIDIDKEKDNKLIVSKDTICQTDVRRVIEEWNKLQEVGINPIRDIKPSSKRYQLLKGRIREYGIDEVLNAINNVRNSDFLRGENNRGWMITFDWFVKPNNFLKTLEGNYNKEGQHGTTRTAQRHVKPLIPFEQCGGSKISDTPFAD